MRVNRSVVYLSLSILLLALVACGKSTPTPKPVVLPTPVAALPSPVPTMGVIVPPTEAPAVVKPVSTVAPTAIVVQPGNSPLASPTPGSIYGMTDLGAFRLGSAEAPIVMYDYEDFL